VRPPVKMLPSIIGLSLVLSAILYLNRRQDYLDWRNRYIAMIRSNPAAWEWRRKQMVKEEMNV